MRQRGVAVAEVLVSGGLVGVAAILAFGMQARVGRLFREQQALAEAQETLRASSDMMARELRQAGYLAARVGVASMGNEANVRPLTVRAGDEEGATVRVIYADVSRLARVPAGAVFEAGASPVDSVRGWASGDVALVVRTGEPLRGTACVMVLTGVAEGTLHHDAQQGAPWTLPENRQCAALFPTWGDGHTAFARLAARAYRVKDQHLQLSPSGGFVAGDWVDLASGVVGLEMALRVVRPGAAAEWYAGEGIDDVLAAVPGAELSAANLTLVVRARAGQGTHAVTTTVDLRNLAIGL